MEDFRSDDLRAVARACLARDCDATHVLRVLDQRWTAVDNALERPFAKRVRAATEPVQYVSKFGETVATPKDKEGADEFTHGREFAEFMKLEVGDMTPRETGANKWAYDPRYNRGLRLPDGIYNRRLRRPRRRRWTRSDEARTNFPRSCTEILSSMDDLDDNSLGT